MKPTTEQCLEGVKKLTPFAYKFEEAIPAYANEKGRCTTASNKRLLSFTAPDFTDPNIHHVVPLYTNDMIEQATHGLQNRVRELESTLQDASDQLDYCGYGDSWERECAGDLPQRIAKTLANTNPNSAEIARLNVEIEELSGDMYIQTICVTNMLKQRRARLAELEGKL